MVKKARVIVSILVIVIIGFLVIPNENDNSDTLVTTVYQTDFVESGISKLIFVSSSGTDAKIIIPIITTTNIETTILDFFINDFYILNTL